MNLAKRLEMVFLALNKQLFIIFDLDGTLVDSSDGIAFAVNQARQELGLSAMTKQDVVDAVGDGIDPLVKRLFSPANDAEFRKAKDALLRFYNDEKNIERQAVPYLDIEDMLRELHGRGFSKAIVSNKPNSLVPKIITRLKWDGAFAAAVGDDGHTPSKPHPAALHHVKKLAGVRDDAQLVMVGDGVQDMQAGKAAQALCVWVQWGFNKNRPAEADHAIEGPLDLVRLILKM